MTKQSDEQKDYLEIYEMYDFGYEPPDLISEPPFCSKSFYKRRTSFRKMSSIFIAFLSNPVTPNLFRGLTFSCWDLKPRLPNKRAGSSG